MNSNELSLGGVEKDPFMSSDAEFLVAAPDFLEIHPDVIELGKQEAAFGGAIPAASRPRWLACVLATMCAVEHHGRSDSVHES